MKKRKVNILLILIALYINSSAQIFPGNSDSLNYTQITFEIPDVPGARNYRFVFFNDSNLIIKDTTHFTNYLNVNASFSFGKSYKWIYRYLNASGASLSVSDTNHFSIKNLPDAYKLIRKGKPLNLPDKTGIVVLDGNGTAINRSGEIVWFLSSVDPNKIRDLEIKTNGTIQYLSEGLIKAQIDGTRIANWPGFEPYMYHHDALTLDGKSYLICGFITPYSKRDAAQVAGPSLSSAETFNPDEATLAVLEVNEQGDLLWYFDVLEECQKQLGLNLRNGNRKNKRSGHMNGLAVNDSGTVVYASFKNFSNVFKIRKSDKTILEIYGNKKFSIDDSTLTDGVLAGQHCPILLSSKNLMVFNNNKSKKSSSIIELGKKGEVIWEYPFSMHDSLSNHTHHMGSVTELGNGNYLVCGGTHNNRVFTVSRQKKLTGEFMLFKNDSNVLSNYRVSYSPTLHPSVYSLRYAGNNKAAAQGELTTLEFIIDNGGTGNDTYNIRIMNASGKVLHTASSVVNKRQQNKTRVSFRNTTPDKEFIVEVESAASSRKKTLRFVL